MRVLIVTAVDAEAQAIGDVPGAVTVVAGIGRANAAAATTEALVRAQIENKPFGAVVSAGVAGALPGSDLAITEIVLASRCVYVEEGLITPAGFGDMSKLGFPLGDFPGNIVPVDTSLLEQMTRTLSNQTCAAPARVGGIATVATCSGTDAAAAVVALRTGCIAEAMEGAAVIHAARRLKTPAIELRAISNTTGNRDQQLWDLQAGLNALGPAVRSAVSDLD